MPVYGGERSHNRVSMAGMEGGGEEKRMLILVVVTPAYLSVRSVPVEDLVAHHHGVTAGQPGALSPGQNIRPLVLEGGVADRTLLPRRHLDHLPQPRQPPSLLRSDLQPQLLGRHDDEPHPSEHQVHRDLPQAGHLHLHVPPAHEGGEAGHVDLGDPAGLTPGLHGDETSGALQLEPRDRLRHGDVSGLQEGRHHTDGVVPGEERVDAVLLCDDVAGLRPTVRRGEDDVEVLAGISPGFSQQDSPHLVQLSHEVFPSLQHVGSLHPGTAG